MIRRWLFNRLARFLLSHSWSRVRRWWEWQSSDENPKNWRSLDYIDERVRDELAAQSKDWDDIDAKLRLILGVIGIVFAAALGFQRAQRDIPFVVGLLTEYAMLGFLLAAALVAVVYRPLDLDRPPKPSRLRQRYLLQSSKETKLAVIDSIIDGYNANVEIIERKTRVFTWAFWITAGATGLIGVAIMLHVAVQSEGLLAPSPTPTATSTAAAAATAAATSTQAPAPTIAPGVVTPVPSATP